MLKRKIEQKLIDWKNTENRKPLIIKGCRQCGKTFSVLDFAKKNYKNVVYIGFRKDMPDVFRSADFTILASRYEAFGQVAIESVACGTPVVLANNVCAAEVISDDVKFTFDRNSFESFENAVKQAIKLFPHSKIEDPIKEALQKPLFPSRIEQNCSVRFFFTTSKNGVFLPSK